MAQTRGNLFILSAPSGAGKSSLINALLKKHTDMKVSVSHTTRSPRPGEENSVHYHFVTTDEFKALIEKNDFFEWAQVFDNYYGTSKQAIESQLNAGIDVFLDIDWQGAQQVRKIMPSVQTIFILPPSKAELEQRLNNRGQDSAEIIASRMAKAQSETSHFNEYDFVIVNDDFDTALNDIETIVMAQRLTLSVQEVRNKKLLNDLLK
ncbi:MULTISPECIES: guanylate kinase [unclassified Pseudoalteromonas]|jgi:guanylate kinase|uniref:guanylate kinase n=1 Tax=unclassified Pseudoalteromonas TaxID=194690 RepID=UPI00072FAB3A|nr:MULTISPECIES: guanylate kinase [unclassified Pseudoalteromonas]KTD92616.1 guanylate kinase [Pseudoalteromonas sp. H71]KTF12363.1 guanylate kinase [Pseudoalteromonas sp. 10-33]MBW4968288.1 guanylate kinase [Pseudoalteromonas sp. CR1]TMN76559.1 guanylate kinase [Pseudoalteromonas sp. S410]TMN88119.1 guanylate kinase [Pseudoalteromonas sp. S408]|tara:strand:- start:73 stop:693 length:621 start_codon:yes stop_codon:yes gene_type:complete